MARSVVATRRNVRRGSRLALSALGVFLLVWFLGVLGFGAVFSDSSRCGVCHQMSLRAVAAKNSPHASIPCRDCHAGSGVLGLLQTGVGVQQMTVAAVFAQKPSTTWVDDSSCRSCHRRDLAQTGSANGIRMRHSDVLDKACSQCHQGVAHTLSGVAYRTPQQDDCTPCHNQPLDDIVSCQLCHVGGDNHAGAVLPTAWQSTHGPGWEETHGSGNLDGCVQCHKPSDCARCHGIELPHPQNWGLTHGAMANYVGQSKCRQCHAKSWCNTSCHAGVPMPHPAGFLPTHGVKAGEFGLEACHQCHTPDSCSACHYQSAHPHVLKPPSAATSSATISFPTSRTGP